MKTLKFWAVHALHWAVLYGAFVLNEDGAMYVLKFFVWCLAILAWALLTDSALAESAKKPRFWLRETASRAQAWATLGLLIWFGHIATALAWGWCMVVVAIHRDQTAKKRAAPAAA